MADYYPLIARAVAGLDKNNGESRRALYERARTALLTQLRGVTPALDESDITRERLALEESIRKVEAEAARKFAEPKRQPPPPRIRPIEPRSAPEDTDPDPPRRAVDPVAAQEPRPDLARRPRPPSPAAVRATPSLPMQSRVAAAEPRQNVNSSDANGLPPPLPLRGTPERRIGLDSGENDLPRALPNGVDLDEGSPRAKSPRDGFRSLPADLDRITRLRDRGESGQQEEAPQDYLQERPQERQQDRQQDQLRFDRHDPRMLEPQGPHGHNDFSEPMLESSFPLDDATPVATRGRQRPPHPADDAELDHPARRGGALSGWRPGPWLSRTLAGGFLALALVAVFAWQWPNMIALYRGMRTPSAEATRDAPPSTARPKITDRIEPGAQMSTAPTPGTQAGAAVAQKVVLYEEDPVDPNGKRFVGSAIWRTETVTPGPGQAPELAVRADVEVPERKITMTWSFRRNLDKTLPASHTVEIIFKLPADFPSGGISNVPGILMKQAEQTRGVPLAGLAVKVTNGFFLIGLSSAEGDKERNLQLLKERGWFDIPVVYNNNRRAILALEKGNPGERAFAEAFKVWKQ